MRFSLVIPCYNEAKNIPLLVKKYRSFLKEKKNELILVNNGSKDKTKLVIKKFLKIKNIRTTNIVNNKGFGYGLFKGIFKARGRFIIYSHADLEVNPKDIFKAIKIIKKNKKNINKIFVKGHRINKIKNNWTSSDIFFSIGLTIFCSFLFFKKLYDIHGMPVAFSKNLLTYCKYRPKDFTADLAIYNYAKTAEFRIIRFKTNFNKKNRKFGSGSSDTFLKKILGTFEQITGSLKLLINSNI
ncbi:MAG: glycosyl transferase family 2 [Candidatus Marinimicrobia bacterium]|nr:glycosyl transferase family 2 [Candidatus Neomarinimicrobiota bacterium]|tara:strand:+ start:435 stop:1157 length:723 start_codon:yes stop_codon:yes gene_type:complete